MDSEDSQNELNTHKLIMKEALWALSNLAAGPPYILDCLFSELTLPICLKISQTTGFSEIFTEGMFVLTNLVTNAT